MISMIFDTGAQVSLIDEDTFQLVANGTSLIPASTTIREYSGRPIDIKGAAEVLVETNENKKTYVFL